MQVSYNPQNSISGYVVFQVTLCIVIGFLILSHICLSLPFMGAFHVSIVNVM